MPDDAPGNFSHGQDFPVDTTRPSLLGPPSWQEEGRKDQRRSLRLLPGGREGTRDGFAVLTDLLRRYGYHERSPHAELDQTGKARELFLAGVTPDELQRLWAHAHAGEVGARCPPALFAYWLGSGAWKKELIRSRGTR